MLNNCSTNCVGEKGAIQDNSPCFQLPVFQVENVPPNIIVSNCAVNILLLVTSTLGNFLVISAVWKTPTLRCPSNVLLCGLATTDLAVGLVVQPLFLYVEIMQYVKHEAGYPCALGKAFHILSYSVCGVSLLTVTAISVDRLLALQYHLRYVNVVTVVRVMYLMMLNWLVSIFMASVMLWSGNKVFLVAMAVVVGVCLILTITVHVKIYGVVRRHQKQIQTQREAVQTRVRANSYMARFKGTGNAVLIHYFLLLCYTPLFITLLLTSSEDRIDSASWKKADIAVAWKLTSTIVFLNSAVNPFIYCWRLQEMRTAVKNSLKAIFVRK